MDDNKLEFINYDDDVGYNKKITVEIKDNNDRILGTIEVVNEDPYFLSDDLNIILMRGYKIRLPNERIFRNVVSVATILEAIEIIEITAPKQVTVQKNNDYLKWKANGKDIELRPGTQIIGGRYTGFYDDYGVILQAEYIGGSFKKNEDWAYLVLAKPGPSGNLDTEWLLLDRIGLVVEETSNITEFKIYENIDLDALLKNGEDDILEYFIKYPEKLNDIHPKQFEDLVAYIYKNLGFNVELIGAWNQADGGIDIIAISKSFSGFEYKLAIQCKASKNKISAKPIRELAGVMSNKKFHQGVVATTTNFTSNAIREKEGHFWNIDLVDKDNLIMKMASILIENDKKKYI